MLHTLCHQKPAVLSDRFVGAMHDTWMADSCHTNKLGFSSTGIILFSRHWYQVFHPFYTHNVEQWGKDCLFTTSSKSQLCQEHTWYIYIMHPRWLLLLFLLPKEHLELDPWKKCQLRNSYLRSLLIILQTENAAIITRRKRLQVWGMVWDFKQSVLPASAFSIPLTWWSTDLLNCIVKYDWDCMGCTFSALKAIHKYNALLFIIHKPLLEKEGEWSGF